MAAAETEERCRAVVRKAEELVASAMAGRDASHDAAHAFRVRDLALSLAREEENKNEEEEHASASPNNNNSSSISLEIVSDEFSLFLLHSHLISLLRFLFNYYYFIIPTVRPAETCFFNFFLMF